MKMFDKALLLHAYNRLKFGPKKLEYSDYDFRQHREELEPTIFLSTGRCGTKWLTERLEKSKTHVPIHHPSPVMRVQARMMYEYDFNAIDEATFRLLSEIFLAGREEIFVSAKKAGKELAITDSRGTFFAYVIAALFPRSKFVFIHRHPFEVIRSGLKRGWYTLENSSELNRIEPREEVVLNNWNKFTNTQKIAWLWMETNRWIIDFLGSISPNRHYTVGFNNWRADELLSMFQFMNSDVSNKEIEQNLKIRSNAQTKSINPAHSAWTDRNREEAWSICGELAGELGYEF